VAEAVVRLKVDASGATRALNGVQSQTNKLQSAFGGLRTAIGGIGLTLLARNAIKTSANFEKLNVRLGLLTKASGTFAKSQELAAQAQKSFGLSATEALEGITDITARLQPLGVSVDDIKTTFFGFNTAAKLAGASAIESSNAFRQLAQALGSGRLQGDEFRSISEQIPTILKPVADELGTTVGELKKFSSEGKITSAVVIRALKKIENEGGKSLAKLLKNDPTQVFKNLSNETENLSRAFGDALAPAILPVIRGITEITRRITDFINSGAGKVSLTFTGIAVAIKSVTVITPILIGQFAAMSTTLQVNAANSILASTGLKGFAASSFLAAGGITKAAIALNLLKVALVKTGIGAAVVVLGTLAAKFIDNKNATEASAKAAKDFDNNLKGIIETADKTEKALNDLAITNKEFQLSQLGTSRNDKATAKRLEREIDLLKDKKIILDAEAKRNEDLAKNKKFNDKTIAALKQITTLQNKLSGKKEEQITLEDQINEIKKEYTGEDAKQLIGLTKTIDELKKKNEELDKSKKKAEELKQKFKDIGEEIEGSIKNNLRDAITGAQSFGDAMTNVLNRIRDKIIDNQLDKLISGFGDAFSGGKKKGLGGFLGGILGGFFANGGSPPVNKISVVGEKGPELFVPRTSGTILPSTDIGGGLFKANGGPVSAGGGLFKANGGPVSAGGSYLVGERGPEILQMGSRGGNSIPNNATDLLGFANGGRPPVNKISVVGERGRELFVPKTAGTIIPNNQTEEILKNQILKDRTNNLFENITKSLVNKINGDTVPKTKGAEEFIKNSIGKMFRENGGSVKSGQPYIVGERQPELFVPRTSGTIIPSVPTGEGNTTNNMITVNVDASGTSVQGNGSEADQLGGLIASIVQATIIDESRAGGLLNR
jgi:tape measure domain-containing protein